jgi:hypothetical protein
MHQILPGIGEVVSLCGLTQHEDENDADDGEYLLI